MDCHSTFWPPFFWPHSTNVLPTASSVTVFQFAENQTLKTPAVTFGSGAGAAAAGAAVGFASAAGLAASPGFAAGAAVGWPAAAGAAGLDSAGLVSAGFAGVEADGWLHAATRAAPLSAPSLPRKRRRDHDRTLRCVSIDTTSTPGPGTAS